MASSVSSKKQKSALIWKIFNSSYSFNIKYNHSTSIKSFRLWLGCYGVNFYGNSANSDR